MSSTDTRSLIILTRLCPSPLQVMQEAARDHVVILMLTGEEAKDSGMYMCPINMPRNIYFSDPGNSDHVSIKNLFFSKYIYEQIQTLCAKI